MGIFCFIISGVLTFHILLNHTLYTQDWRGLVSVTAVLMLSLAGMYSLYQYGMFNIPTRHSSTSVKQE